MTGVEIKAFTSPEEKRPFVDKGQGLVVTLGGKTVIKGTFQPGWHWKEHLAPIAGPTPASRHTCSTSSPDGWPSAWTTGPRPSAAPTTRS